MHNSLDFSSGFYLCQSLVTGNSSSYIFVEVQELSPGRYGDFSVTVSMTPPGQMPGPPGQDLALGPLIMDTSTVILPQARVYISPVPTTEAWITLRSNQLVTTDFFSRQPSQVTLRIFQRDQSEWPTMNL